MKRPVFYLGFFLVISFLLSTSAIFAQKTSSKRKRKPAPTAQVVQNPVQQPIQATVNTPVKSLPLNKFQQEIFDEINALRADPLFYVKILEEMKSKINGKVVPLPDGTQWEMNEGLPALTDAINSLKIAAKAKPFAHSSGLSKVADIQLSNLKQDMTLGHFGQDGSDIEVRLMKIGFPGDIYAENIAYHAKNGRTAVLLMIIDDGLKSRSHRKNLLSTQYNQIGIAFGNGKNDVGLSVVVFADRFTEKNK